MKIYLYLSWTDERIFDECYHCCTIKNAWESCGIYSVDSIGTYFIDTEEGKTVILYPKDITTGEYISEYPVKGECVILSYGEGKKHSEICWKYIKEYNIECLNSCFDNFETDFINPCTMCQNEHDDDSVCTECEGKGGRRLLHEINDKECKITVDISPTQTFSQYDHWTKGKRIKKLISSPYHNKAKQRETLFLEPHLWLGEFFCNVCNEYHGKLSQQCSSGCTGEYFLQYTKNRCEVLDHINTCKKNDHSNCQIFTKVFT